MSDFDKWIPQVGRIHVEAKEALELTIKHHDGDNVPGTVHFAAQFNQILDNIKERHPSDNVIESIHPITGEYSQSISSQLDDLGEKSEFATMRDIKLKSGRLIDRLGYSIPDDQLLDSDSGRTVIQMVEQSGELNQTTRQSAEIGIETTIEQINHLPDKTVEEKKKLRGITRDFKDELDSEDPDNSRLDELIQSARQITPQVAVNLISLGVSQGVIEAGQYLQIP